MNTSDFAYFGAEPAFPAAIPVGQHYFPSMERYKTAFRGIFDRQYYNNNGPLHEELEDKLGQFFGVRHAICVSNATLGLMIVADAIGLTGKVILPSFAISTHSITWAGLKPVFCDVSPASGEIAFEQVDELIDEEVSAIIGVNLFGGACNVTALEKIAKDNDISLYFDSSHAFGCCIGDVAIGNFGDAEVFSFNASNILNSTEGGCICTNDDGLAAKMRSIRPSYGQESPPSIVRVANARMSEAQAAMALMSLEDFPENQKNNKNQYRLYERLLKDIPGLYPIEPTGVRFSNYQSMVCRINEQEFGLSRDLLIDILRAENVIAQRITQTRPERNPSESCIGQNYDCLKNAYSLSATCLQLPLGSPISSAQIFRIGELLRQIHHSSTAICDQYEK